MVGSRNDRDGAAASLIDVSGEPGVYPAAGVLADTVAVPASGGKERLMVTLFVRHQVKDFAAWRQAYTDFAPEQKRGGVTAESVYQAEDNPNDVTVTHEFASLAAAKAFTGSAELRDVMNNAGVVGTPTIWFTHKA